MERGVREEAARLRDECLLLHGRLSEAKLSFAAVETELEQVQNFAILWYKISSSNMSPKSRKFDHYVV